MLSSRILILGMLSLLAMVFGQTFYCNTLPWDIPICGNVLGTQDILPNPSWPSVYETISQAVPANGNMQNADCNTLGKYGGACCSRFHVCLVFFDDVIIGMGFD
ncbi:hypothetical protein CROQUDRAFT_665893 [Cronartium quercuum f. sp. fusiforme G11]|uniref:Uncharacterized protein n=1 Tax=Cronartium quercuum f. sp. fusiforme G11 TaxID=708437 RepID=A0A9P6T5N5_9BASI|nr:hypothetical protein CROQUDRAFT_665893 [Cronartium quercuum f. sp. fusiforme G11]